MLPLIGLILLLPPSLRLFLSGRRRTLPRPWLAWLPFAAPAFWAIGVVLSHVFAISRLETILQQPHAEQFAVVSDAIADSLQYMFGGGIAACLVLAGCGWYFSSRPFHEPSDEDL